MTLYIIGLGLCSFKDISVKGLEYVKSCDVIYVEGYTSLLQCSIEDLEKFYGKKIVVADRNMSEQGMEEIVNSAQEKKVGFLVIGDPFSATTHVEIFRLAKEKKIDVKVVHNASVLTAVGITGLQLYKFGKTTSIPFLEDHPKLETPYNVLIQNKKMGLHTLCLLDLKPKENKFMSVKEALDVMKNIESRKKEGLIGDETFVIGCARLGCDDFVVKSGLLKDVVNFNFGKAPHCLIFPGDMHFSEKEITELYSVN